MHCLSAMISDSATANSTKLIFESTKAEHWHRETVKSANAVLAVPIVGGTRGPGLQREFCAL
jgi:hypothetical protein